MPALSVCLIVKNEARHLARCLESVRGLAGEIVVVDTGSTDATIEIAQALGARVHHAAWQDDFSAARNVAIDQARGRWILSLDADESIAARDHDAIRAVLARRDVDAVTARQRHYFSAQTTTVGWQPGPGGYEEGAAYPGFVDVTCRRLFRRQPWLRFRNRVHEALVSTDASRPLRQVRGEWVIHHFGKTGGADALRAKGEMYLRIGAKKIEDQPGDPLAHYELGVQHATLEQPDAALPCFERALALSPGFRDAQFRVALCHVALTQHDEALRALRLSAATLPHRAAEIAVTEGTVYRQLGDERAAEQAFRAALAARPVFPIASVNLARLYARQGRSASAIECVERALADSPAHPDLRQLRATLTASSSPACA